MSKEKPYLIVQPNKPKPLDINEQTPKYIDIHAGGFETSLMIKDFPELVDTDLARNLKSSCTTIEELKIWAKGGEKAREITPLGYCGNPSEIDIEATKTIEIQMTDDIPKIISDFIKKK